MKSKTAADFLPATPARISNERSCWQVVVKSTPRVSRELCSKGLRDLIMNLFTSFIVVSLDSYWLTRRSLVRRRLSLREHAHTYSATPLQSGGTLYMGAVEGSGTTVCMKDATFTSKLPIIKSPRKH